MWDSPSSIGHSSMEYYQVIILRALALSRCRIISGKQNQDQMPMSTAKVGIYREDMKNVKLSIYSRLRYGVLVIGLLGCIVNMAGMVAYAILQVPGLREKMNEVLSIGMDVSVLHTELRLTEDYRRTRLIYM